MLVNHGARQLGSSDASVSSSRPTHFSRPTTYHVDYGSGEPDTRDTLPFGEPSAGFFFLPTPTMPTSACQTGTTQLPVPSKKEKGLPGAA